MEAVELNSVVKTPLMPGGDSILLGPGAAVSASYLEARGADEPMSGNFLLGAAHALRRRWFAITVLGLLLGSAAGTAFWFLRATEFTAVARVRVPERESLLAGDGSEQLTDFEMKKRQQMQLITSQGVLKSVVADENVVGRNAIQKPGGEDEQIAWLRPRLSVTFPGNAHIMELRVRSTDLESAKTLAEAIRSHYLERQGYELKDRAEQIRHLKDDLRSWTERFRIKQNELVALEEQAGAGPPPTPEELERTRQRQQHWNALNQIDAEIWDAEIDLEAVKKSVSGETPLVTDEELLPYLESDEEYKSMNRRRELLNREIETQKTKIKGKPYEQFVDVTQGKIKVIDEGIADLTGKLRQAMELQKRQSLGAASPAALEQRIATLKERRTRLDAMIKELTPKSVAGSKAPVEHVRIELARYEAANLRTVMDRIQRQLHNAELAKLENVDQQEQVGIHAEGEVYHLAEDDERRKLMQSCAAGGAVFMAISALIVLFDLRRHRLNDAADVSSVLQLNVLGTVPLLRGRGAKRLEQSARLAEAVDGVAATLLCRTSGIDQRVVMISSAMAGEGKTTLAANLATSLAAAGRRTLLVDFDLRRPMLHQVYQVPIAPGLGELLSEGDLSDFGEYLQETMTENLWLIPAGAKRQAALAALSDERVSELFQEFKEHFEFIIVDGPPVLLVVDTRLVARHADGVVISMLRDVSELPKVKAACQLLQSYRVRIMGGVVIGAAGDVYYGYAPERSSNIA